MTSWTSALAKEAGTLIRQLRQKGLVEKDYKAQQELVTSADLAADKLIIEKISALYPEHRILSEETYTDRSQISDLASPIWIIDPIDGTVNFAHGQSMVAVSIALAFDGEVQLGVVYNPFMDELFCAYKGSAALLNDVPISVSGEQSLRKSLIATGFPYNKDELPPILERIAKVLPECQDIRRLGSAALDICWVACGRLDGYFESLSPWDFAAARLIALQAGARCGHFTPVPEGIPACLHNRDLLISTPEIYDALDALLD